LAASSLTGHFARCTECGHYAYCSLRKLWGYFDHIIFLNLRGIFQILLQFFLRSRGDINLFKWT
jgi:hypothetical protein